MIIKVAVNFSSLIFFIFLSSLKELWGIIIRGNQAKSGSIHINPTIVMGDVLIDKTIVVEFKTVTNTTNAVTT